MDGGIRSSLSTIGPSNSVNTIHIFLMNLLWVDRSRTRPLWAYWFNILDRFTRQKAVVSVPSTNMLQTTPLLFLRTKTRSIWETVQWVQSRGKVSSHGCLDQETTILRDFQSTLCIGTLLSTFGLCFYFVIINFESLFNSFIEFIAIIINLLYQTRNTFN